MVYYEELVDKCLTGVEDSTASTSNQFLELNNRLKNMACDIENSKCTHVDKKDSTASTSNQFLELNNRLKNMACNIKNSKCTHVDENDDFRPLIVRYQSIVEHGGALSFNQTTSLSDNNKFRLSSQESLVRKALQ